MAASNTSSEETNVEQTGKIQEEKVKHQFSEPWDYSDLILAVENEKFNVHRALLSMNSPVFKAMFQSQFKEATSSEIPLPEKKADEVLDFLKQIYFPYIKERVEITMENVGHLLKLSDEYQVSLSFDPCTKFVREQSITKENVMKLLGLAELYGLDDVRQGCNNLLKNMRLKTLSETVHLEDLDLAKTRHFLEQRIERLEAFLDALYPQFMGLVSCTMWLMGEGKKDVRWCTDHVVVGKYRKSDDGADDLSTCKSCAEMICSIVGCSQYYPFGFGSGPRYPLYGGRYHFDESLPTIITEFSTFKKAN